MDHSALEAGERKKVGMVIPPPFLLMGLILVCVLAHTLWFGWAPLVPLRALAGLALMVAAIALIGSCGKVFRNAGTPVRPVSPTTTIVSAGAYRFSRNPMYVGMAGVLAGVAVFCGSYLFAAALLVFVAVVHFGVVLPEERYLEALHGAAYLEYKERVRRWL